MDINWTQVFAQAISTAIIVPAGTITTFVIMRYFPRWWEALEKVLHDAINTKIK